MPVAQPLFPSSLLSVVPMIVEMLDDVQLDNSGKSGFNFTLHIMVIEYCSFLTKITNTLNYKNLLKQENLIKC